MNAFDQLWERLGESKEYREEFVAAQVKQAIPFQIRALLKDRGWTQEKLAGLAGIEQGVVSRAANPSYGNLTLNTIVRIAAGFDVAFIGKFVPFSELGRYFVHLSEVELGHVPSFTAEYESATKPVALEPVNNFPRLGEIPAELLTEKGEEVGCVPIDSSRNFGRKPRAGSRISDSGTTGQALDAEGVGVEIALGRLASR